MYAWPKPLFSYHYRISSYLIIIIITTRSNQSIKPSPPAIPSQVSRYDPKITEISIQYCTSHPENPPSAIVCLQFVFFCVMLVHSPVIIILLLFPCVCLKYIAMIGSISCLSFFLGPFISHLCNETFFFFFLLLLLLDFFNSCIHSSKTPLLPHSILFSFFSSFFFSSFSHSPLK